MHGKKKPTHFIAIPNLKKILNLYSLTFTSAIPDAQ
jgi:hypothetical protein